MKALSERLISGVIASALLPFALYAEHLLIGGSAAVGSQALLIVPLYALPVFLMLGPAASVAADWFAERVGAGLNDGFGRLRAYAVNFVLYAAAGFGIMFGLVRMLFGIQASGAAAASLGASVGIPAALLFFHVLLTFRTAGVRAHRRRFGVPVETERLLLLPCTEARYEEAVEEGYPIGNHVRTYLKSLRRHPRLLGWGIWFVRLKETGELIGDAGFKGNPDLTGAVDIGYGFLPEHHGRGYATETASALVAWAFAHGAGRVTAETLRDNAASIRVLRKNGFRLYREEEHYYWRLDAAERLQKR